MTNIYLSPEFKSHWRNLTSRLTSDQLALIEFMEKNKKGNICMPTGAGKGVIMRYDILNQIQKPTNDVFAIVSHRLMLNSQHMNDLFQDLSPLMGHIGFIFVGSNSYDIEKLTTNSDYNRILSKQQLAYKDIISTTTNTNEIGRLVDMHTSVGRDVVIIATYHSLDRLKNINIDTIYCDEAHMLASEEMNARFKTNFDKVNFDRSFFLTATPKDCFDTDSEAFLMNNKEIFGERVGISFKDAVLKGYIIKPFIHIAKPSNYDVTKKFTSTRNFCKLITESYITHKKTMQGCSAAPEKLVTKILVKCPDVDSMWKIQKVLTKNLEGKLNNVNIYAGASRNDYSTSKHFKNITPIDKRDEYLEDIQASNEDAIILQYDILSEGINVSGISAVMFLNETTPTITKTLQTIGRATRLHSEDRYNLKQGTISTSDYSKWIKPYCAVILPIFGEESDNVHSKLSKTIRDLRNNFGFDPTYYVSIGEDIAKGNKPEEMEGLNEKTKKELATTINTINHEIEQLDMNDNASVVSEQVSDTYRVLDEHGVDAFANEIANLL